MDSQFWRRFLPSIRSFVCLFSCFCCCCCFFSCSFSSFTFFDIFNVIRIRHRQWFCQLHQLPFRAYSFNFIIVWALACVRTPFFPHFTCFILYVTYIQAKVIQNDCSMSKPTLLFKATFLFFFFYRLSWNFVFFSTIFIQYENEN